MSFLYPNEEYGQYIAKVSKKLGDQRFACEMDDGKIVVGKMRGALRKCRIEIGDYVLVEPVMNLNQIVHKYDDNGRRKIESEELYKQKSEEDEVKPESDEINFDDI